MSRRKKYIKGFVYYTNDSILVKSKPKKRRVVAINNDPIKTLVKRILSANGGRNARKGIPIEKYPDIQKDSVVENRTISKGLDGKPISTNKMKKSKTRLNKWDRKRIGIK